jgi:hypothetical protein
MFFIPSLLLLTDYDDDDDNDECDAQWGKQKFLLF